VKQMGKKAKPNNELDKQRIKGLIIKGFGREEIAKITKLRTTLIDEVTTGCMADRGDTTKSAVALYSELQKDLAKLVMLETNKEKRDASTILNAIKLQAELQEKKLQLSKGISVIPKISKNYIKERDNDILEARNNGAPIDELTKTFEMSKSSINQAIDRASLKLPEELSEANPSLISETRGLSKKTRITIIRKALEEGLDRTQVRAMSNTFKNETR